MRRRRSEWPAPGHVLRLSFLSLSLHAVASWHAFLGQEAVPTISGTSLQSSLQLPAPSTTADDCQVALTSLTKITGGRLCLQQQERCSLQCAVVWGSLLRDVGQVVGSQCTKLKEEMAAWRPDLQLVDTGFLGGVTSPVSMDELERLSAACSTPYKCPDHHCKPSLAVLGEDGTSSAPEFASLTPPALTTSCDFEVKQGEHTMRFLTWKALHESYLAKATGCVGGLSNSSGDAEHTTWACIHQPKCPTYHLPKGDLACFKYSHIRGEFHFWDWNRNLALMPPLFQVPVSFCDMVPRQAGVAGRRRLVDATTGTELSVYASTYRIREYTEDGTVVTASSKYWPIRYWTKTASTVRQGAVYDLGADGCNEFTLQGDVYVELTVNLASYIFFQNPFYVGRDASGSTLTAAVFPIMTSPIAGGIGLVLEWGAQPLDLDLWVTVPKPATGRLFYSCSSFDTEYDDVTATTQEVRYWYLESDGLLTAQSCQEYGGVWEPVEAWDDDANAAIYWDGPEYAVSPCSAAGELGYDVACEPALVSLKTRTFEGYGPETLSFTGMLPDGQYRVYVHAYSGHPNSNFESDGPPASVTVYSSMYPDGSLFHFEVGKHTWKGKQGDWWQPLNLIVDNDEVSLQAVDRIVLGYSNVPSRTTVPESWDGTALSRTSPIKHETKIMQWDVAAGKYKLVLKLFPHVRSIIDEALVDTATYAIYQSDVVVVPPGALVTEARDSGIDLLPGEYKMVVAAGMYVDLEVCITMRATDRLKHQTFWLVPADNKARAVLRWRSTPRDLDLYVVPLATGLAWKDVNGLESTCPHVGPQSPTLNQGVSRIGFERTSAPHPTTAEGAGQGFGPKSVTLTDAAPGQYRVLVHAPPVGTQLPTLQGGASSACEDDVFVDIYFDGLLQSTIKFDQGHAKWWYVGYFNVQTSTTPPKWVPQNTVVTLYDPIDCVASPLIPLTLSLSYARDWSAALNFEQLEYSVMRVEADAEARCQERRMCSRTCDEIFSEAGIAMCFQTIQQLAPTITAGSGGTCAAEEIPADFTVSSKVSDLCPRLCSQKPCSTHRLVAKGEVGPDQTPCANGGCPDKSWTQLPRNALYLPAASYVIKFELAGYVSRVEEISLSPAHLGGVTLSDLLGTDLVMIPTTSASEIIVVLTWAVTPLDLDLWLVSADNPATATYWDNTGPNDGVRLDKDDTDGYGPEVITLTDTTAAGDYRVAVNVYTSNGENDCTLESNDICRFAGLETVSFYGSFTPPDSGAQMFSGLIARSIMPRAKVVQENSTTYSQASAHSWWLAGIVTRNAGGNSIINTRTTAAAGASSAQNLDTTCGAIRTAPGGTKCLGEYCDPDIGCTSNCGNCVFDRRRHSRRSSKKTFAQVF